jgi:mRNA interferase RelE/StbE
LIWKIEFDEGVEKDLRKLDRTWQLRIKRYLLDLGKLPDPRLRGKPLHGDLAGMWRFRVGDYRVLCEIQDNVLIIRVITIGHRRSVYK